MKKQLLLSICLVFLGKIASAQLFTEIECTPAEDPTIQFEYFDAPVSGVFWAIGMEFDAAGAALPRQTFYQSSDEGATWNSGEIPTPTTDWRISSIHAASATSCWATFFDNAGGNAGKIYRTDDAGATWIDKTPADMYAAATSFANFTHFFNDNDGLTMGDPAGGYFEIWSTADGGETWTRVPTASIPNELSGEFGLTDGYCAVGDALWFVTNKGRLYRTEDKGVTWKKTTMPFGSVFPQIQMRSLTDGIGMYTEATGTATLVAKTINGGDSFENPVEATILDFDGAGTPIGFQIFDAQYVPGTTTLVGCGRLADASPAYVTAFSVTDGAEWHLLGTENEFRNICAPISESLQYYGGTNLTTFLPVVYKNNDASVPAPEVQREEIDLSVYPNPVRDLLEITADLTKNSELWLTIENTTGRVIRRELWSHPGGSSSKNINVGSIPSGVYTIRLSDGSEESIRRFIVIH